MSVHRCKAVTALVRFLFQHTLSLTDPREKTYNLAAGLQSTVLLSVLERFNLNLHFITVSFLVASAPAVPSLHLIVA